MERAFDRCESIFQQPSSTKVKQPTTRSSCQRSEALTTPKAHDKFLSRVHCGWGNLRTSPEKCYKFESRGIRRVRNSEGTGEVPTRRPSGQASHTLLLLFLSLPLCENPSSRRFLEKLLGELSHAHPICRMLERIARTLRVKVHGRGVRARDVRSANLNINYNRRRGKTIVKMLSRRSLLLCRV